MNKPKLISLAMQGILLFIFLFSGKVIAQTALIKEAKAKLVFSKDSIERVNTLNRVGFLYHEKDIDSCFSYGMKAKILAGKIHYAKGIADADNVLAISLGLRGLYKESLELFNTALKSYRQQADTSNIAQVLMNMALTYNLVGDTTKEKLFYLEAMTTAGRTKQDSILSLVYLNYAISNSEAFLEDSVRYYLDKSQAIAQRYNDDRILISVSLERAYLLMNTDKHEEALLLIQRALDKSRNDGVEYLEMNILGQLGVYYKNDPDSALKYYSLTYKLIEEKGYTSFKTMALQGILEKTELIGNKDSIIKANQLMTAALAEENENLKKFIGDYIKYNVIQEDNRLLEASNSNKQTKIWFLIALCSICSLLAVFIYRQYRVSRNLHKTVSEQNNHLREALVALEQSQADNTRIMKIVAHDLRNPIGAMISIAYLLVEDKDRSENDKKMLELLKTAGENSLELVDDLLRIHTRVEELKKEPVDLYQLLHYCVELLHFNAEKKMQQINLRAKQITLEVNREKMWRVVSNLIGNAIKFSPKGSVISVTMEKKANEVIISVKDQGIGIPDEMKDKLFNMFTEARRTGTAGEKSFGLGLAISKQIVEAHGGNIWYESTPGEGATFFVELPS
ncbi:hypothetical protein GFS24_05275 [Chitinophaga sp. SYP-B3965]|uniref:ATP-binding protein n=1 Tax=Chitinophaga sp. SYP-B3965 TaxID=2663120 RepID=UPI00129991EC|nr:tetratricopeptide repeat-containing sensor histidine kinase [Chitinophaga sp. SYP-B3965]MRG44512.1 hypothetical protein [Chitinophaga sp. SYP-B3965]